HRPAFAAVRAVVAAAARPGRGPGDGGRGRRRPRVAQVALRRLAEAGALPPVPGGAAHTGGAGRVGPGELADPPDRTGPGAGGDRAGAGDSVRYRHRRRLGRLLSVPLPHGRSALGGPVRLARWRGGAVSAER